MITQAELTALHETIEEHKQTALETFKKHPNADYVDLVCRTDNGKFYNMRYTAVHTIDIGYTLVSEISSDDFLDAMNEFAEED